MSLSLQSDALVGRVVELGSLGRCARVMDMQPTKVHWILLASMSLVVPASILMVRERVMCPNLGVQAFELLPLSGYVHGHSSRLFARIMHNLTHPVLMLSYTVVLGYLSIQPISKAMSHRSGPLRLWGLVSFHLMFIVSYFITLFLPIGFGQLINPSR